MNAPGTIRAILFQQGDLWVGQCLEHDIGAQGDSLEQVQTRLRLAIVAEGRESERRFGKPFANIPPAPAYFEEKWNKRAGGFQPTQPIEGVELALCA